MRKINRYKYRTKYISCRVIQEENRWLTNATVVVYNCTIDNYYITNTFRFKNHDICPSPRITRLTNYHSEEIRKLMTENPYIGMNEIRKRTGFSWLVINRCYMKFRKENSLRKLINQNKQR